MEIIEAIIMVVNLIMDITVLERTAHQVLIIKAELIRDGINAHHLLKVR